MVGLAFCAERQESVFVEWEGEDREVTDFSTSPYRYFQNQNWTM